MVLLGIAWCMYFILVELVGVLMGSSNLYELCLIILFPCNLPLRFCLACCIDNPDSFVLIYNPVYSALWSSYIVFSLSLCWCTLQENPLKVLRDQHLFQSLIGILSAWVLFEGPLSGICLGGMWIGLCNFTVCSLSLVLPGVSLYMSRYAPFWSTVRKLWILVRVRGKRWIFHLFHL